MVKSNRQSDVHCSMKMLHFLILLCLTSAAFSQLSVMSYNIRYDNAGDSLDAWPNRRANVVAFLQYYHPEIIGLQEALHHQVNYIDDSLDQYAFVGVGRDDGSLKGEFSPIFYDSSQLSLINSSTFWLSETPEEVSVGWDAALPRICTWAIFEDKSAGRQLLVLNTHFDHIGEKARQEAAILILQRIQQLIRDESMPVILMGDLNALPESRAVGHIQSTLTDTYLFANHHGPDGTFNGFGFPTRNVPRIDYVFTRNLQVVEHAHLLPFTNDYRQLSDHWPVWTVLKY